MPTNYRIAGWVQAETPPPGYRYKEVLHIRITNDENVKLIFRITYKITGPNGEAEVQNSVLFTVPPKTTKEFTHPYSYNYGPKKFDWDVELVSWDT